MRKSISDIQDQILRKMEKDRGKTVVHREPTLKEQLDALEAYEKLTSSEKLAKMSWREWSDALVHKITNDYNICSNRHAISIVHFTHKAKFQKLHEQGVSFLEISQIIQKELPDNFF